MTVTQHGVKLALVTGASRGIGSGIAERLASDGYRVIVGYFRSRHGAMDVVERICDSGGEAAAVEMDVASRAAVVDALDSIRRTHGPIDVLINNAAISQEKPFLTLTDDDWEQMLAVNLKSAFVCSQLVLPDMIERRWGRIVNISSIGGQWGGINQIHYATAKAGLIGLTRSLAKTFSQHGVTTNAIAPGLVATDMSANELESAAGKEKVKGIPAGRIGSVAEVAAAVSFLCSDEAAYVTGQTLNLNGGMYFG